MHRRRMTKRFLVRLSAPIGFVQTEVCMCLPALRSALHLHLDLIPAYLLGTTLS